MWSHSRRWLKVFQVRSHSIHMPSMMSHVWACVVCPRFVSLLFISHFYFASFTIYLFSVRHNFHNVVTAEGYNHCTHAQWGVLHRGDIQSSHSLNPHLLSTMTVYIHTEHAFSPIVMTICSHSFTDARSAMAQEKDSRHVVTQSQKVSSEIELRRRGFFKRFEFLVCSRFSNTHKVWLYM